MASTTWGVPEDPEATKVIQMIPAPGWWIKEQVSEVDGESVSELDTPIVAWGLTASGDVEAVVASDRSTMFARQLGGCVIYHKDTVETVLQ